MAAKKVQSPAMEFLVSSLKKDKKASYADLKAKADARKLSVYPIMFGRAQALLGIVKSAKRGTGRFAKASAALRAGIAAPAPAKRGPGRPRKVAVASTTGLEGILAAVRSNEQQRTRLRGALERIQAILADALD